MKRLFLLFMILNSWVVCAHEDSYIAIEKSNVHFKIRVGYEESLNLSLIKSYAEIINRFIREIDSSEKVFIQFEEDYCFNNYDLVCLAYGEFKNFLIPIGFPFSYNYNMNYIYTQKGVNVIIAEKYFKLKPLLQLIEYGLHNKDKTLVRGNNFHKIAQNLENNEANIIITSVIQNDLSDLSKKYLSNKIEFLNIPETLKQKGIIPYLQNDSIFFVDRFGAEILRLSTIYLINYDKVSSGLFLLNTDHSFYFIDKRLNSNKKENHLQFALGCSFGLKTTYLDKNSVYKLEKSAYHSLYGGVVIVDAKGNEIIDDWVFFDEIKGVSKP